MSESIPTARQKRMTPLWVISLFLSLTEVVIGLALTKADGNVQAVLTAFAIAFPIMVATAFFAILWNRPYVLYPPTEFGDNTDVGSFVGAMKPSDTTPKSSTAVQPTLAENISATSVVVASEAPPDSTREMKKADEDWFALYEAKEYDGAISALRGEAKQTFDRGILEALVGRILLDKNRSEGLAHFERTFSDIPLETEPYVWLASEHSNWQEYEKGISVLDRGLSAGANDLDLTHSKRGYSHVQAATSRQSPSWESCRSVIRRVRFLLLSPLNSPSKKRLLKRRPDGIAWRSKWIRGMRPHFQG